MVEVLQIARGRQQSGRLRCAREGLQQMTAATGRQAPQIDETRPGRRSDTPCRLGVVGLTATGVDQAAQRCQRLEVVACHEVVEGRRRWCAEIEGELIQDDGVEADRYNAS